MSLRLKVIISLYIVAGLLAVLDVFQALSERRIDFDFAVLLLPIGIGLAYRKKLAHRWAVIFAVVPLALSALLLVFLPGLNARGSFFGASISPENARWLAAIVVVLSATFSLWVYSTLRSLEVKRIFDIG